MTNTYCTEFKKASEYVHTWLTGQPAVGEESITDWILFELSKSLPELKYTKFTRHEEARTTGADWEWWIVDDECAIKMRIQAKKIISGEDNYARLAYTNNYGLQIEKLIRDAEKENFIPLYALYSAANTTPEVICGGQHNSADQQGIFISSAQLLFDEYIKNGKSKVKESDILSHSNPLHCMACCSMYSLHDGNPSALSFYAYIKNYYGRSLQNDNQRLNNQRLGWYEHKNIPLYVKNLLKPENSEIPDWWEEQSRHELDGFNSLAILDLRQ